MTAQEEPLPDSKLKKLYPQLSDEEPIATEKHFEDYGLAVVRVAEEIENDPDKRETFEKLLKIHQAVADLQSAPRKNLPPF